MPWRRSASKSSKIRRTLPTASSGPSTCTASDRRSILTPSESSISLRFSSRVPNRGSRFGVISRAAFRWPPVALPQRQNLAVDWMCVRVELVKFGSNYLRVAEMSAPGWGRCEEFPYWRRQPSGCVWGESSAGDKFRQSHPPLRLMQFVTNSIRASAPLKTLPGETMIACDFPMGELGDQCTFVDS
jgi:hypothetical protein